MAGEISNELRQQIAAAAKRANDTAKQEPWADTMRLAGAAARAASGRVAFHPSLPGYWWLWPDYLPNPVKDAGEHWDFAKYNDYGIRAFLLKGSGQIFQGNIRHSHYEFGPHYTERDWSSAILHHMVVEGPIGIDSSSHQIIKQGLISFVVKNGLEGGI
jgi:hypothetical protein